MLRQMSRRSRLAAMLYDDNQIEDMANILEPKNATQTNVNVNIGPMEQAEFLKKSHKLTEDEYGALLQYLQDAGQPYRPVYQLPHPANALILPPIIQTPLQVHRDHCTFSCQKSHKVNSGIQFYNPSTQTKDTGFIETIWTLPLDGTLRVFFVVRPHLSLSIDDEKKAPFMHLNSKYSTRIVDDKPADQLLIIEMHHIITHLTTFQRPLGTYGINKETLITCWALNRGRK